MRVAMNEPTNFRRSASSRDLMGSGQSEMLFMARRSVYWKFPSAFDSISDSKLSIPSFGLGSFFFLRERARFGAGDDVPSSAIVIHRAYLSRSSVRRGRIKERARHSTEESIMPRSPPCHVAFPDFRIVFANPVQIHRPINAPHKAWLLRCSALPELQKRESSASWRSGIGFHGASFDTIFYVYDSLGELLLPFQLTKKQRFVRS